MCVCVGEQYSAKWRWSGTESVNLCIEVSLHFWNYHRSVPYFSWIYFLGEDVTNHFENEIRASGQLVNGQPTCKVYWNFGQTGYNNLNILHYIAILWLAVFQQISWVGGTVNTFFKYWQSERNFHHLPSKIHELSAWLWITAQNICLCLP